MADLYVRIDDRLIHGQTIVAWCPTLQIKEIVAVDDVSAKNPMLKTIMTMGVPGTYKNTHCHDPGGQGDTENPGKREPADDREAARSPDSP